MVVSAPDPNQPQHGSLPVSHVILDAMCTGVGLGLVGTETKCMEEVPVSVFCVHCGLWPANTVG